LSTAPAIPANFIFSASSLQDYVDCPRRFQLRYLQHCDWPAVESEPVALSERHMERGRDFHRLAHQHYLGISDDLLTEVAENSGLGDWWADFLAWGPADLPPLRRAEFALTTPLAGYRLEAKYDLVATGPGRLVIVDWKTNVRRPPRAALDLRLQTRVYPFVLAQAGGFVATSAASPAGSGASLDPAAIEMVYWFTGFPRQPEVFRYSAGSMKEDEGYLARLISEIVSRAADSLPAVADSRRCRFCVYRSFCERQVEPAGYDDEDADSSESAEPALDMEQIAEIVY
jgi:CRISPR/Cas system-associated exonuclease Cas4 (RecB family)